MAKVVDWAFKAFTTGMILTTVYVTGTFSFNVYRGLAWHNDQKKLAMEQTADQS